MQPLSGADEVAGRHNDEKSPRQLGIQGQTPNDIEFLDIKGRFSSFFKFFED